MVFAVVFFLLFASAAHVTVMSDRPAGLRIRFPVYYITSSEVLPLLRVAHTDKTHQVMDAVREDKKGIGDCKAIAK